MPTYTYHCGKCDEVRERRLRMSQSSDPQECELCGELLEKLIDNPVVIGPERLSRVKATGAYADRLRQIKASHPGSDMGRMFNDNLTEV